MSNVLGKMTKGEEEFIDQMTRKYLVEWCDCVVRDCFPAYTNEAILERTEHEADRMGNKFDRYSLPNDPYTRYAIDKKWISAERTKILSAGWDTASRFLKR